MWICDTCGEPIEKVEDGWVEWLHKSDNGIYIDKGLRLVHHKPASPLKTNGGCQYKEQESFKDGFTVGDLPLKYFLNDGGLMLLLEKFVSTTLPKEEIIELIKRLHIKDYEKARPGLMKQFLEILFNLT